MEWMGVDLSESEYDIEYLMSRFELVGTDPEVLAHWEALLYLSTMEWRLDTSQRLLQLVKRFSLSPMGMNQVLMAAGNLYQQQQVWHEAEQTYRRALAGFRRLGAQAEEAETLNMLGVLFQEQGNYDEAALACQAAVDLYRHLNEIHGLGYALGNLANIALSRNDWEQAVHLYQACMEVLNEWGDNHDRARTFNNLGVARENLGDLAEAEHCFLQCVDLLDAVQDAYSEQGIRVMSNLGQLYAKQRQWERAISCCRAALDIAETMEDVFSQSTSWNNLGALYQEQGEYEEAADAYRQSIALHMQIGDRQGAATVLSNLGASYDDSGDYVSAETCYYRSLELCQELAEPYGLARAYNNLGVLARKQGHYERSIQYYLDCIEILRQQGDAYREITTLTNLCSVYELAGLQEGIPSLLDRAQMLTETYHYHDQQVNLCMLRADLVLRTQGHVATAAHWYAQACCQAQQHAPSLLAKIVPYLQQYLHLIQQTESQESVQAFCQPLLEVWSKLPWQEQFSDFVDALQMGE